ncbi:MAG: APC family permease [Actinomycetia bacterium]|nr:APC family permease [Actinomycetes bacterium]
MADTSSSAPARKKKVFGLASMVLFAVTAILVGDTIGSSAAMGVQGITFWIILAVLFFIPYGFATSELGAAWPDDGGIYVWVREAFGPMWGSVTAWLYWVNVALWAPSVFVLFSQTLQAAFGITVNMWVEMAMVIVLIWIMVAIGIIPLKFSKWVPNVSAIVKIVIFVLLGLAGVVMIFSSKGLANSFALKNFIPKMSLDNLTYLPVVIYSFMGFELMSSVGDAVKDPKKDIPKMILLSGAAILFIYVFATFGVLATIPVGKIAIETGIVDALLPALTAVFGAAARPVFIVVALGVMFTFIGNMVTWSIGSNESLAATGMDETAPGIFGHRHAKWGTPDYAFILMGVIATVTTVLTYTLLNQKTGAFWTIFVLSSVVFLLPYLLMFPALVKLRYKFPDHPRPYRAPWGNFGVWLWAILCELGIVFTLALFFLAPDPSIPKGVYYGVVTGASIVSIAVGFILYFRSKNKIDARYLEDQKKEKGPDHA